MVLDQMRPFADTAASTRNLLIDRMRTKVCLRDGGREKVAITMSHPRVCHLSIILVILIDGNKLQASRVLK